MWKVNLSLAVALVCSGCACNLNWQRYRSVRGTTMADSARIREDFAVQVIGTDHSRSSGLTSDIRAPYSIHTVVSSRVHVAAYEMIRIHLISESGTTEILGSGDSPVRVPCAENEHGLFIGRYTFPDAFEVVEPTIEIRIEGRLILRGQTESFSFHRKFRLEAGKKRWISISDMMSI